MTWRLREKVISALFRHGIHVKCLFVGKLLEIISPLMPLKPYGYFMQSTNLLFLLIIYSLPDNRYSVTKCNHKKTLYGKYHEH